MSKLEQLQALREAKSSRGGKSAGDETINPPRVVTTSGSRPLERMSRAKLPAGVTPSPRDAIETAGTEVAQDLGKRSRVGRQQQGLPTPRLRRESGGVTPTAQKTQAIGVKRAEVQGSATVAKGVESPRLSKPRAPAGSFDRKAYQRDYMRGRRARQALERRRAEKAVP